MNSIYLDNNATTPLLPAVWEAMRPFALERFGNAASAHHIGRRARQALEDARERCAALLGAHPDELIFTSGATEANNLALFGSAGEPPGHLIVSPIEHPSVTEPIERLRLLGFSVDRLAVSEAGTVDHSSLEKLVQQDTRLLAVMLANHETGAIQPVAELAARAEAIPFHCDAVQAAGKIPLHFADLGVTTLSISAHKFHGPQGIGALLIRRGASFVPRYWGGHQQQGRRPGTEAVALAVGMATALDIALRERTARTDFVRRLRERFLAELEAVAAPVVLNGPRDGGIPYTVNVSFPGCQADSLLMNLDLAGVACSTGSACSSGSLLPSPVLQAMGVPEAVLHSALRFSLSALLSEDEVVEAARRIGAAVRRLRQHPPFDSHPTPANGIRDVVTAKSDHGR